MSRPAGDRENPALVALMAGVFVIVVFGTLWGGDLIGWALEGGL